MTGLIDLLRSMNRWALAAGLGATLAVGAPMVASAQDFGGAHAEHGHHGRGMGARHFARMASELGLTPAQETQIRTIMQQARAEGRALREQTPAGQRGQAMRQLHERVRNQIRGVLTPEQQARAVALRQQHAAERGERRIERMRERLSLTPSQEAQIRGIFENARAQRAAIAQQGQPGSEAQRNAMRSLRQRTHEAVRDVLTPDQQALLDQHGRGHHGRGFGRGR